MPTKPSRTCLRAPLLSPVAAALALLCLPASAQQTAAPAPTVAAPTQTIEVLGNALGMRQTRANAKITAADLDFYPPGVSADKVLERVSGIQIGSSNAFGGDGFESTINMRGFSKDSIGFSIDGVPNGRTTLGGGSVPTRYFDTANLAGVDVSQSAGVIGSPSHQALAGHVNYLTDDPARRFTLRAELAGGSAAFGRAFARVDSGELAPGLTGYLSVSSQQWQVSYVDDPAGRNLRDHVDLKLVRRFSNGAVVKFKLGWNDRQERSGTNIVTLRQFNANAKADGYTDRWTGAPATDRNFRGLKGNPREDMLAYLDLSLPLGEQLKLTAKVYQHEQDGTGKESGLGNGGFPGLDGRATSLYFRANEYGLTRRGVLAELGARRDDWLDWRVGGWVERASRSQVRRWYPVLNEAVGPDWSGTADATSEDKHWVNTIQMVYAANRSTLMAGRLRLDYGFTAMNNTVDYSAPIHDSRTGRFNFVNRADVGSGALPKAGFLLALTPQTEVFGGAAKSAASVTDATLEGNSAATLAAAGTVTRMDSAKAFDLGVRHRGSNYVAGVQAFSIRSTETIAADIAGTLQSENVDQGRQIRGLEATYSLRLADWRLYAAATVQQPRYVLSDVDTNGNPPRGFIRNGADVVGIAPRNLFVEATWRPADALKLAVNGRMVSSAASYYANPRVANSGVDERIPGYTLLGANVSWTWEKTSIGLNVENITNRTFISGVAPELMTTASTVGRYFIGAPRSAVLWLKTEL